MRRSTSTFRVLSIALLALGATVATTGCFKKGARGEYAMAPEMRPLEVPPDLTNPNPAAAAAASSSASTSVLASQASRPAAAPAAGSAQPAAASPSGFTIPGSKDEVYGKVGTALEGLQGVTIASRAQLLGSYDVAFEGSNFLVRVVAVEAGAYISAVDPRGQPATAEAPVKLIAALKAQLAP